MKLLKIALGTIGGAVAGFAAGILLAPRSGAESRAMASDAVNDAWDSAIDTYERGQQAVNEKIGSMKPGADEATDELRAKVDLARERMDQLRDSLSNAVDENGEEAAVEAEVAEEATVEVEEAAEAVEEVADVEEAAAEVEEAAEEEVAPADDEAEQE